MRYFVAVGLFLAGCGAGESPPPPRDSALISCALGGSDRFTRSCRAARTARTARGERSQLVLSDPDGGFRRVTVSADGAGVVAADGAEPARIVRISGGEVEIAIAEDRYRLPASAAPPAGK